MKTHDSEPRWEEQRFKLFIRVGRTQRWTFPERNINKDYKWNSHQNNPEGNKGVKDQKKGTLIPLSKAASFQRRLHFSKRIITHKSHSFWFIGVNNKFCCYYCCCSFIWTFGEVFQVNFQIPIENKNIQVDVAKSVCRCTTAVLCLA